MPLLRDNRLYVRLSRKIYVSIPFRQTNAMADNAPIPNTGLTPNSIAPQDYIAGLAKGLQLLQAFDHAHQRLNATQAASRTGLTRAAARRYLLTLQSLGYLEADGRQFWLTPKVMQFSGNYLASAQLPRVVQPYLDKLAAHTGGAFSVVVADGGEVVIVARSRSPLIGAEPVAQVRQTMTMAQGLHLGARLPMHATSTGQILLAQFSVDVIDAWLATNPLTRLTPRTITSADALRARLAMVRSQHWIHAADEHEWGVQAIAVPLQRADGQVVAALNVVLPSDISRAAPDQSVAQRWLLWLHETAAQLRTIL